MSEREVIMVLFDLSIDNNPKRRAYTQFVKYLKQSGYTMFQKSVYVRILKNSRKSVRIIEDVLNNAPKTGTVSAFSISLKDFELIRNVGENIFDKSFFSDDIVYI